VFLVLELESELLLRKQLKLIYLASDRLPGATIEETLMRSCPERNTFSEEFFPFESVSFDNRKYIFEKDIFSTIIPEWETDNNRSSPSDGSKISKHGIIDPSKFPALFCNLVWGNRFYAENIPEISFRDDGSSSYIHFFWNSCCDF
jgi:hypothetical protein